MYRETITVPLNELEQRVYGYLLFEDTLQVRLREFQHQVRESKRHKWRTKAQWGSNMGREPMARKLALADVPLSVEVDRMALANVMARLAMGPPVGT